MANLVLNEADRSADVGFVTKSVLLPLKKMPATLKTFQRKPSSPSARKPCRLILRKRKDEAASLLLRRPFYRFYLSADEQATSPFDSQQDRRETSKKRRPAKFFKPTDRMESNKTTLPGLRNSRYLKTEKQVNLNFPSSSLHALKWLLSKRNSPSLRVDGENLERQRDLDAATSRNVKIADVKSFDSAIVKKKEKSVVSVSRVDRDSVNSLPAAFCKKTLSVPLRKKTLTRARRRDVRDKDTSYRKSEDIERIFAADDQQNERTVCSKETLKGASRATTIRSSIDLTDIHRLPANSITDRTESSDTASKRSYLQIVARPCKTKYSWQTIGKGAQTSRTLIDESTRHSDQHFENRFEDCIDDSRYECTIKYSWQIVGTGTQTSVHDYTNDLVGPAGSFRIIAANLRNRDTKRPGDPLRPLTVRRNGKFYLVLTERAAQTTADKENQADFVRICIER